MSCGRTKNFEFLFFVARQRYEANRDDIANNHEAVFCLRQYVKNLHLIFRTDRDDHEPTNRKLLDQRFRDFLRSSRYQDDIERGLIGPARITITDSGRDVVVSKAFQSVRGTPTEHLDYFYRVDAACQF